MLLMVIKNQRSNQSNINKVRNILLSPFSVQLTQHAVSHCVSQVTDEMLSVWRRLVQNRLLSCSVTKLSPSQPAHIKLIKRNPRAPLTGPQEEEQLRHARRLQLTLTHPQKASAPSAGPAAQPKRSGAAATEEWHCAPTAAKRGAGGRAHPPLTAR